MPLAISIQLKPSPLLLIGAVALLAGASCTVVMAPLASALRGAALVSLCIAGILAIEGLLHGRTRRALSRLEWLEGPHWVLEDGSGRRKAARLARSSRRLGRASLLIFERGVFGRYDRPCVLVLPNMVSDPAAARRLRARLTLDGNHMRGLDEP